jgi:hypothetical protein
MVESRHDLNLMRVILRVKPLKPKVLNQPVHVSPAGRFDERSQPSDSGGQPMSVQNASRMHHRLPPGGCGTWGSGSRSLHTKPRMFGQDLSKFSPTRGYLLLHCCTDMEKAGFRDRNRP